MTNNNFENICFFVGPNRSGSSVVAIAINAHPNAKISYELGRDELYNLILKSSVSPEHILDMITKNADHRTMNPTSQKIIKNEDGTFVESEYKYKIKANQKGQIKIIGDKSPPWLADRIYFDINYLDILSSTFKNKIKFVQVIRNPWDVLCLLHILKKDVEKYFFRKLDAAEKIKENIHRIFLEDLIENPKEELKKICEFLDLDPLEDYIQDCTRIIWKKPHRRVNEYKLSQKYIDYYNNKLIKYDWYSKYPSCPL